MNAFSLTKYFSKLGREDWDISDVALSLWFWHDVLSGDLCEDGGETFCGREIFGGGDGGGRGGGGEGVGDL